MRTITSTGQCFCVQTAAQILIVLVVFAATSHGQAKSGTVDAVARFEASFDAFTNTKPEPVEWLKPPSPWAPLLGHQFFNALEDEEKERSLTAQRLGQCEPVISDAMHGFFNLYADLQAIMIHADIRANFKTMLLPQFSHALKRCQAFAKLIPIMEATRRRYGLDETFAVALPQINVFLPGSLRIPDTTFIYHNALSEIYRLGLCEGFTPALEDVVWFETEIRTHQSAWFQDTS